LSDEQRSAFFHVVQPKEMACVVGYAGTGKSYLLGAAREAWEAAGYRVQGMTLSGIAAENLESGSGIQSHTVANRLFYWEQGREQLTNKDVVVVDEAGMLGSCQMASIFIEARRSGAKVVLVGDPEQLQAIEAGAAFRAITQETGFSELSEIRRQQEPWQQQATRDLATQKTAEALSAYDQHDNVHLFDTKAVAMKQMLEQWDEVRSQSPDKSQIILAYTRDDVRSLNEQARALRQAQGELGQDQVFETSKGERTFAEQDRIYFLRNENRELGVKNGSLGTIEKINGHTLTVRLDTQGAKASRSVTFNVNQYNDIDHGYAATVYKAQGVTVDRAHVLASKHFDRHTTYVAMSRHREGADLYASRDEFKDFTALTRGLSQERTKDISLDYGKVRGFETTDKSASLTKEQAPAVEKTHTVDLSTPAIKETREATPLTEDRAKEAEKRLALRLYQKTVEKDLASLEKETGLKMSMTPKEGDKGIYRGTVEVAGRKYGILEQEHGNAKLIRADLLDSREKGKLMVIEKQEKYRDKEIFKAIQPEVRDRSRDRGMSYGGL